MATATTEEIERIVREVMLQLEIASKAANAAPADVLPVVSPAARHGDVVVDSRVVTLATVAGRLEGAKQLIVPPAALVTPAVRDELRRKGVVLLRGSAAVRARRGARRVAGRGPYAAGPGRRRCRHSPKRVLTYERKARIA